MCIEEVKWIIRIILLQMKRAVQEWALFFVCISPGWSTDLTATPLWVA
jgi:hypothetical protein